MASTTVAPNGQILVTDVAPPAEQIVQTGNNSYITQAGNKVTLAAQVQNATFNNLGGKQLGGAAIQVHPPMMPTAGNATTPPDQLYANLYALKAQGQTDASYDGLYNAAPQQVTSGGRKKTRKHKKNGRSKQSRNRHHNRNARRTRRVRRTARSLRQRR